MINRKQLLIVLFGLVSIANIDARSIRSDPATSPYTLEDFLTGAFYAKSFNGSWITGDSFLYKNPNGVIRKYDASLDQSEDFLPETVLSDYKGSTVTLPQNQHYLLIRYNVSSVFRHSTTALYTIYNIDTKEYYHLHNQEPLQFAKWAPVGNGLVYVYKYNIYYIKSPEDYENPVAITSDTNPEGDAVIYNGVPDWVYEEEVLGSGSALWFSPDGSKLAFAQFNDTNVPYFPYFMYGTAGELENQYPKLALIRYPKVNHPNPVVKTFVADLEAFANGATSSEAMEIPGIPEKFLTKPYEIDYILYDITWPTNEEVAIISSNRVQNRAELVRCTLDGNCRSEATYESDGWLVPKAPHYGEDGTRRLEILPQPEEDDKFNHLVITNSEDGSKQRLTQGRFVVTKIHGWDEPNDVIYFEGSRENATYQQHIYAVKTDLTWGACLTCNISTPEGNCLASSAMFSKDFSHFVRTCQGPGPNLVHIVKSTDPFGENAVLWEDNAALREKLKTKSKKCVKDVIVPVSGYNLRARLLLPPDLDESKKYPAIVNVYAGPDTNSIKESYTFGYQDYLVTNRSYIYVYIDGRGSGRDGQKKLFEVYRRLGTVEIQDQIAVMKILQQTFPFIDAQNTGIWGWSYGGFATASVLEQDTGNVFKFGLSVAPVTHFAYYDSIYTERYMGLATEEDNLEGYNKTDVTQNVEKLSGKLFFLIHGNADDNVHYQQSMLLSRALELADIPFRQQSYPDENHSLQGVYPHLYHTIDAFFEKSIAQNKTA